MCSGQEMRVPGSVVPHDRGCLAPTHWAKHVPNWSPLHINDRSQATCRWPVMGWSRDLEELLKLSNPGETIWVSSKGLKGKIMEGSCPV